MSQFIRTRLDVRHLIVLDSIAKWGSATAAADHLGVTPSAISHRLREAERRLDVSLTMREGNGMRLTEAALRLSRSADRLLDELQRAEIDAMRISRGGGRVVRLGIGTYSYFSWLPDFVRFFRDVERTIRIDVAGEATHQPLANLRDERVDILLMPGRTSERGVHTIPCFTDELVCVMAPDHPLAGRDHVDARDLENQTHITYSTEILPGFEYDSYFRPARCYPEKLVNIAAPEAVAELVSAGQGISVLSRWAVGPRLQNGSLVAARLTSDGLMLEWNILYRKKDMKARHIDATAQALAHWLTQRRQ